MTDERWAEFMAAMPTKKYTALTAIKDKCIECRGGEDTWRVGKDCKIKTCPLYYFLRQHRLEIANRPKRVLTDEQRQKQIETLRKYRENLSQNQNCGGSNNVE